MTESKPMHILGLSPLAWVMNILIIILLCAILALPPISLIERVTTIGYTTVTANDGAVVKDAGGTTLVIPSNAVGQNSAVKLGSVAAATFVNVGIWITSPDRIFSKLQGINLPIT